jgi:hypothetical protein
LDEAGIAQDAIKRWFMAEDKRMIFKPAFRFSEKPTWDVVGSRITTNLVSNLTRGE